MCCGMDSWSVWDGISQAIMITHDISDGYSQKLWDRAIICYTVREIFMYLSEQEVGPTIIRSSLHRGIENLGVNFDSNENDEISQSRESLKAKIKAIHEVIAML